MNSHPMVTVILPTHNHASTLEFSVQSVLEQTFRDFELIIVGDGIDESSRLIINKIMDVDSRVHLIEDKKSFRHAETLRDQIIQRSLAKLIAYHGDDDLMLPNHLLQMLVEIGEADFIHPLPIKVGINGDLTYLPVDISRKECIDLHLNNFNCISLTGVVHTRDSYMELPVGWSEAPLDIPTDLYMWKKFFNSPKFKGKTSSISSTIKLDGTNRRHFTEQDRNEEIMAWWKKIHQLDFDKYWQARIHELLINKVVDQASKLNEKEQVERNLVQTTIEFEKLTAERDALFREFHTVLNSKSWKITNPLRILFRFLRN